MKIKPVLSARQITPLIEIILAVVFFAGAATIIIQIFAKAHNDSRFAHDINSATLFAGECAERIRTSDYDAISDTLYLSGFEKGDNENYYAYLDSSFASTSKDMAYSTVTFGMSVKETETGRLLTGQLICIRQDGEELIRIDTAVFFDNAED